MYNPIGLNLAPLNYGSPCPYRDLMRAAHAPQPQWPGKGSIDPDGWPGSASEYNSHVPMADDPRSYVLIPLEGAISYVRVTASGQRFQPGADGRIAFTAAANSNGYADINVGTNGRARWAIVQADEVDGYLAGDKWRPGFVDTVEGKPCLRFMDLCRVNAYKPDDAPLTTWTPQSAVSYSWAAMPVEDMADICARVGADMWFNVPASMPDTAAVALIARIRALLPSWSRLFVEWSNEVWNTANGFMTGRYLSTLKPAGGPATWYGNRVGAFAKALDAAHLPNCFIMLAWQFWGAGAGGDRKKVLDSYLAGGGPRGILYGLATAPYPYVGPNTIAARMAAGDTDGLLSDLETSAKAAAAIFPQIVALTKAYGIRAPRYEEALSPFASGPDQLAFCMKALASPRAGAIYRALVDAADAAGMDFGCFYTSAAQGVFGQAPDYDATPYPQGQQIAAYNRRAWPFARKGNVQ